MTMSCEEIGGPEVREPARRGFGSRLICMGLIGTGSVELLFKPEGLLALKSAPLSQTQRP